MRELKTCKAFNAKTLIPDGWSSSFKTTLLLAPILPHAFKLERFTFMEVSMPRVAV